MKTKIDNKTKKDKPPVSSNFVLKNVFDTTSDKIDLLTANLTIKRNNKVGIAEVIDEAITLLATTEKIKIELQ